MKIIIKNLIFSYLLARSDTIKTTIKSMLQNVPTNQDLSIYKESNVWRIAIANSFLIFRYNI